MNDKNTEDILGGLLGGKTNKKTVIAEPEKKPATIIKQQEQPPKVVHSSYQPQKSFTLITLTPEQKAKVKDSKIKVVIKDRKWGPQVVLDHETSIYGFGQTLEEATEDCIQNIIVYKGRGCK